MPSVQEEQKLQLAAIIKQLETLNNTMGTISINIARYIQMIGNQPAKTNV